MQDKLSKEEKIRYDRQIMIKNFGKKGQQELKSTTALIAGAGGLGSPASIYLAIAGIGKLRIVDTDQVELSNLNRQILYQDEDIGENKAVVAKKKINKYNPNTEVEAIKKRITDENISKLRNGCDLIVDCMDNYPTRYVLNKESQKNDLPLFHAAVEGMNGQATTIIPGRTPCLNCIIPTPPPSEKFPVLGATPGLLGTIQAHEVIKYIVGIDNLLTNYLLLIKDGIDYNKIKIQKNPDCEICGE
ncbi:adenylyltransferase [candidate division MSBL1 archaeon SCGC-AAA382A13]|uniref:Adenylyltransferase n=1 Tax=candidate division MSBL1 archaeon SCGC-AAA382A13 TaxID=1698279 RepID=A0A133VFY1_9EURY|nr:adenylyltransferase [candidate division MSBL1 archaeon SCGC-AAA382A13]